MKNYNIVSFSSLSTKFVLVYYPEGCKHLIRTSDGKFRYDDEPSPYDISMEDLRNFQNEEI